MKMAAPPGWTRRPRQFTLPSVAGQIKGRPAMFRFRRGKATTSASRSTTIAGGSRSPDSPPLPYHESCPRVQHTGARTMLGVLYEVGRGVPRDVGQRLEWFDLPVSG